MRTSTERYKYVDDTLTRAHEVLRRPEIVDAIGSRSAAQSLGSLEQLFVPNVAAIRGQFVYLQTPDAYQGHPSAMPVMAGYPGERLVGDERAVQAIDRSEDFGIVAPGHLLAECVEGRIDLLLTLIGKRFHRGRQLRQNVIETDSLGERSTNGGDDGRLIDLQYATGLECCQP
jgi:hypothetical protein